MRELCINEFVNEELKKKKNWIYFYFSFLTSIILKAIETSDDRAGMCVTRQKDPTGDQFVPGRECRSAALMKQYSYFCNISEAHSPK